MGDLDLETATERQLLVSLIKGQREIMTKFSDLKDAETTESAKIDLLIAKLSTIANSNATLTTLVATQQQQIADLQGSVPTAEDVAALTATAADIATETGKIDAALATP